MPRFIIDSSQIKNNSVTLSAEESRHALQVLRVKSGDVIDLFDGKGGEYRGIVIAVKNNTVSLSLDKSKARSVTLPQITLAVSVIKPERMDLLLQKASELGVGTIIPLLTERTVVRLPKERWDAKLVRWQKIVKEACKQCGQTQIPTVHPVRKMEDFLKEQKNTELLLIPTLATSTMPLEEALRKSSATKATVLIGPEGDFTPQEVGMALQKGALPVSLGPLVMRSETAALYMLSVLLFFFQQKTKN